MMTIVKARNRERMDEVTRWIAAVPTLVGFGLALGFSPVLYGATADILGRNQNVRARLTWLLSGLVTGATVLALVLHGLNPANLLAQVHDRTDAVVENRFVDLTVGVILLLVAAGMALWVQIVPDAPPRKVREPDQNAPPASLFVLGFSAAIVGITTLPIMYLTGRLVESLSTDPFLRLIAYSVFVVALVEPFVLLAWIWSRFPVATTKVTEAYGRMLAWDFRWVACALMTFGGLLLIGFTLFVHR
ncbi:Sap-like sulfolipid-1-addressing protein [Dietzia psychralcaliphila]|nr:Sap-like sulfolipid-1-addressing protein [Dietzia psychralcaliphila]